MYGKSIGGPRMEVGRPVGRVAVGQMKGDGDQIKVDKMD